MAYKDQKKNKRHSAELRKKNSHRKHERKRMRSERQRAVFITTPDPYEQVSKKQQWS